MQKPIDLAKVLFLYSILLFSFGCKNTKPEASQDISTEFLLAKYKNEKLVLADIEPLLPVFQSPEDSIQFISVMVDKWIRNKVYLEEAKMQIKSNEEIERLVDDYRSSLILDAYEENIFNQKIDSSISDQEYLNYYNQKKAEYKLESPILRMMYVKILKQNLDQKIFMPLWEKPDGARLLQLQKFCQNNAEVSLLQMDKWNKWNDIKDIMPSKFVNLNTLQSGLNREFADFKYNYFLKIRELVKPNETPPLSFFKIQATKSILHDRKEKLIEQTKSKLYERELKNKSIQNFVK
ncbi:MAG TPA: hypothetical protein PK209_03590 [Saprospiraceae bacterium]|nr:hypothetical protein [Saprospiraceae bacterium]HQX43609.1 hypothetical protein [Saprospiraceae bacterium]